MSAGDYVVGTGSFSFTVETVGVVKCGKTVASQYTSLEIRSQTLAHFFQKWELTRFKLDAHIFINSSCFCPSIWWCLCPTEVSGQQRGKSKTGGILRELGKLRGKSVCLLLLLFLVNLLWMPTFSRWSSGRTKAIIVCRAYTKLQRDRLRPTETSISNLPAFTLPLTHHYKEGQISPTSYNLRLKHSGVCSTTHF